MSYRENSAYSTRLLRTRIVYDYLLVLKYSLIHTEAIYKNDNIVPLGKVWQKHPDQKHLERLLEVK